MRLRKPDFLMPLRRSHINYRLILVVFGGCLLLLRQNALSSDNPQRPCGNVGSTECTVEPEFVDFLNMHKTEETARNRFCHGGYLTVDFNGQLGNVMFQYAAMLTLARKYRMTPFIAEEQMSKEDVRLMVRSFPSTKLRVDSGSRTVHYQQTKMTIPLEQQARRLDLSAYCNATVSLGSNALYSRRFFDGHRRSIDGEFVPHKTILRQARERLQRTKRELNLNEDHPEICFHIRTGDFNQKFYVDFGYQATTAPQLRTYLRLFANSTAVKLLICHDADWCRQAAKGVRGPIGVLSLGAGDSKLSDMASMALCRTLVLTTSSTFGFWGGFLDREPGRPKVVYRPRNTARHGSEKKRLVSERDAYMPNWIVLE